MANFWQSQLDYILFANGAAFLLLAVSAFAIRQASARPEMWTRLALFGVLHGTDKWLEMLVPYLGDSSTFKFIRIIVMIASFAFLADFGRLGTIDLKNSGHGRWLTTLLIVIALLFCVKGWDSLFVGCRYSLALVGGLWSAFAFASMANLSASRREKLVNNVLMGVFICYAVVAGVIVPKTSMHLTQFVNRTRFFESFGFPIQVLSSLLAIAITIGVWILYRCYQKNDSRLRAGLLISTFMFTLACGWVFTNIEGQRTLQEARYDALNQCRIAMAALDPGQIIGFGYKNDIDKPQYPTLRQKLFLLKSTIPDSSLLYLMHRVKGKVVFSVDSAAESSRLHSAPGDIYTDAPPELIQVFDSEKEDYVETYTDQWGTWSSAFIPIVNPDEPQTIAVLGLDIPRTRHILMVAKARLGAIIITMLVILLLCMSYTAYEYIQASWLALSDAEKRIRASEKRHRSYVEGSPDGIFVVNSAARFLDINPAACIMTGYSKNELLALGIPDLLKTEDVGALMSIFQESFRTGKVNVEFDIKRKDGVIVPVVLDGTKLSHDLYIAFCKDITRRKHAEEAMIMERERLSVTLHSIGDGVIATDIDGKVTLMNTLAEQLTGWSESEAVGHHVDAVFKVVSEDSKTSILCPVRQVLTHGLPVDLANHTLLIARDGGERPIADNCAPIRHADGQLTGAVLVFRDVTESKRSQEQLDYQAHHDALTGLPNRLLLRKELESVVSDRRMMNDQCALLFIDLDKFKLVNDTMGHETGDSLLIEIAKRLTSCLRDNDTLARMGGDEFTVILKNVTDPTDIGVVAQRMLESVSMPFEINSSRLVVGASIGISLCPRDATNVDGLLKNADAAMYRAKELGRNNYQFFTTELNLVNQSRVDTERDLRLALERGEFRVYYQPIVTADTMEMVGVEALIRWIHPEKGMISPETFIPVAEDTGLIVKIGRMVLETACKQAKRWQELGWDKVSVSVNVSLLQLHNEGFVKEVLDVLTETDLSPRRLNLEITESMLGKNEYNQMDTLNKLKSMGVETSLDDFGIGYSSLGRLKDFPITHVKVDGSFIRDIENSLSDRAMTKSIITMAHSLGMQVTAEWVENEQQLEIVRSMHCDHIQGYLVSPALPEEEFIKYLLKDPSDEDAA